MFVAFLVGAAGFTLGLYAGKRRAKGSDWSEIAVEMADKVGSIAVSTWRKVSAQFKKGDPGVV